jgi:tyrosine-protein phosphatase YwqE
MNNLFSRNKINIEVEMHCHILPAVGCDPEFTNQALDVLMTFQHYGVNTVYATPHVRLTRPSNTHQSISERAEIFKKQIAEKKIKVNLGVVVEYYVDEGLSCLIDNENLLAYPQSHVLIELPLRAKPHNLNDVMEKLRAKKYKPIIAHPELHHYLRYDWKMIADLKEQGCMFQLNLINMAGYFGNDAVAAAQNLLRSKVYDFVGTGAHSREQLRLINQQILQNKDSVALLCNADFKNKMFADKSR